jgi:hypothetical protein
MTQDLEQLVRKGLREHADAVRVVVPPVRVAETMVRRGRRPIVVPVLAAAVVMAVVMVIAWPAPPPPSTTPAAAAEGPGLPRELAGFSFLTADLSSAPVDRAVAVYRQQYEPLEDWMGYRTHVLAADGERYRKVDALTDIGPDPGVDMTDPVWLLSPDGRQLAWRIFGSLYLLRIGDGTLTPHPLADADQVKLMAWSPDSAWLAYTLIGSKALHLFDTASARSVTIQGLRDVEAAAFSPDGGQLAVQTPGELHFVDVRSRAQTRELPLADEALHLVNAVAWSPDGALLAVYAMKESPSRNGTGRYLDSIRFIDAATGRIVGQDYTRGDSRQYLDMLAWRTDRTILVLSGHGLDEVPVEGGQDTTLVAFGLDNLNNFQLAPGLVLDAEILDRAAVDRGPWPGWFRTLVIVALVLAVLPAAIVVWVKRRRRWIPLWSTPDIGYPFVP